MTGLRSESFKPTMLPFFSGDRAVAVLGQAGVLQPRLLDGQRQDNIRFSFGVTF